MLIHCSKGSQIRTCILVRKGIQCLPLLEFYSSDITKVKINCHVGGGNRDLTLSPVYLLYDGGNSPNRELEQLVVHCIQRGDQTIFGCDTNSHHEMWGSRDVSTRREYLLDFLLSNNLYILNVGNKPTFTNRLRKEVINITFCTEYINTPITDWRVLDELSLSDHNYIIMLM